MISNQLFKFIINILLIILIIILIILLLNVFGEYYCDLHEIPGDHIQYKNNDYKNVRINKIAIAYSKLRRYSIDLCNTVWSHYDLVCNGDDDKWYMIRFSYMKRPEIVRRRDWKKYSHPLMDVVEIPKNRIFKLDGYRYYVGRFIKTKENYELEDIYTLIHEEWDIPYNALRHNCHHKVLNVINIISDKTLGNEFEQFTEEISPVHYIQEFCKHTINEKFHGKLY